MGFDYRGRFFGGFCGGGGWAFRITRGNFLLFLWVVVVSGSVFVGGKKDFRNEIHKGLVVAMACVIV